MQQLTKITEKTAQAFLNNPSVIQEPAKLSNLETPDIQPAALTDGPPVCPDCHTPGETGFFRRDVMPGHPDFGRLLRCEHPFHQAARQDRLRQISQLGPEDAKRRLTDILISAKNKAMIEAAQGAIDRGHGWLYIWGGPGNAKSIVLMSVVNEMNAAGQGPAIYTTFSELLDYIKAGFKRDEYDSRLYALIKAPVLAIDEMDKVKESEWLHEFRFKFLDHRYRSALNKESLTVFAGNLNPVEIFDDALVDRFRDGRFRIVQNTAPSARPMEKW